MATATLRAMEAGRSKQKRAAFVQLLKKGDGL
jgi:hypothetical protein